MDNITLLLFFILEKNTYMLRKAGSPIICEAMFTRLGLLMNCEKSTPPAGGHGFAALTVPSGATNQKNIYIVEWCTIYSKVCFYSLVPESSTIRDEQMNKYTFCFCLTMTWYFCQLCYF